MRRLLAGALLLAACSGGPADSGVIVIEHVTVIDVAEGRPIADQAVVIRDRRIESIGLSRNVSRPRGARVISGEGKYLLPGLWDMHVHADESELPVLVSYGITGARDMGGAMAGRADWRRRIAEGTLVGPRLVLAGPMLAGPPAESSAEMWIITSPAVAARAVDSQVALGAQFIKVHEGLSRATLLAVLRAARARNIPVSGHVPEGVGPLEASAAGLHSIEHLEFMPARCMVLFRPVFEGSPDRAEAPPDCDAEHLDSLFARLARDGTWLDPTVASFRIWVTRPSFQAIYAGVRDLVPSMRRSGVMLLTGTDLGDSRIEAGVSLHDELTMLVEAGFTEAEVLRAATLNPARFLGLSDSLGTIAAGKLADLVLIDGDPLADIRSTRRISAVIRDGKLIEVPQ